MANKRIMKAPNMDVLPKKNNEEVVLEELACINMAKQDPIKFKPLYEKYYEQIFRFIYNRIEDKKLAYDITADVFYKSILKLPTYEFQQIPFSSWLYRIARNELIDIFRKNKAVRVVSINSLKIKDIIDDIELDYREEYKPKLIELIENLDNDDLQLIEMRFFENKSFKNISEIISSTEAAVKMRLYRLLKEMKSQLTGCTKKL
ncbi:MAG: sigma-70 family RNA polymerase sigma factor [Bacteroidota bacterium]|nr:sigma-70 family RNA polymerase sigma factor [Bacteroidota bacterium]